MKHICCIAIFILNVICGLLAQSESDSSTRILVKAYIYKSNEVHINRFPVRLTGQLKEIANDSIYMTADDFIYPVVIPLLEIKKLKISKGIRSRFLTYLGSGIAIGALTLGLPYSSMEVDDLDPKDPYLIGAGYGALGGIIFAFLDGKRERWQRVHIRTLQKSLESNLRITD